MKKKALVLAGCIAFAAPSISIAQALPGNLVGLNLGEIQASSYLNQPFRGVIPFLFTSVKNSNKLKVRLAPNSVFAQIGAERLPIHNDLHFKVSLKANKPVILINSKRPIQQPFLNFVLEVEGPDGVVYQDYTVLLDPPSYPKNNLQAETVNNLLLPALSSSSLASTNTSQYIVKSGDSLSKIAKKLNKNNILLKDVVQGIYEKNPSAFINKDMNKIKSGATLILPTNEELSGFEYVNSSKIEEKNPIVETTVSPKEVELAGTDTYKVNRGDNLSKITRKFIPKDVSFTKMMTSIYTANPDAFSKNNKNLLKVGSILSIPSIEDITGKRVQTASVTTEQKAQVPLENVLASTSSASEKAIALEEGEYLVKEGDTLTQITKDIGYKDVSFTKMMKAIYVENLSSFEKNNITKLKVGSVIRLPALSDLKQAVKTTAKQSESVEINAPVTKHIDKSTATAAGTNSLEKRIRELRTELDLAKSGLSDLQTSLNDKDILISEKDSELINLKSTLIKLKINGSSTPSNQLYNIKSKSEIAELAGLAINKNGSKEISKGFNAKLENFIKTSIGDTSAKNLTYISLALILGLLLIRYRREIYSYIPISYDHPNYYPASEASKFQLKERNICYQDTLVDPESFVEKKILEEEPESTLDESKPQNPVLADEYSEEIEHCEHLVTELFDDLSTETETSFSDNEWTNVEKVCDNYIEKIKEDEKTTHEQANANKSENAVADFEVMMSDLLESLDVADETIISEVDIDEELPKLVDENKIAELDDSKSDEAAAL